MSNIKKYSEKTFEEIKNINEFGTKCRPEKENCSPWALPKTASSSLKRKSRKNQIAK